VTFFVFLFFLAVHLMKGHSDKEIVLVGITGGIGSGKTTAAKYIEQLGYPVIYTDYLAKVVMNTNENVKLALINEFGNEIYNDNGEINAAKLSEIVFDINSEDNVKLTRLNQIVHPPTIELMMEEIEKLLEKGEKLIFVESALIYEAGLEDGFDYIVVIDADEKKRIERTAKRLKLSDEKIRKRDCQQFSTEYKRNMADFVIENNGDIDQLYKSIDFILNLIRMA